MRKMVLCIIAQMALHYINRARRWTPVILCTLCGSGDAFSFGSAPAPVVKGEQYKINLKFIHLHLHHSLALLSPHPVFRIVHRVTQTGTQSFEKITAVSLPLL